MKLAALLKQGDDRAFTAIMTDILAAFTPMLINGCGTGMKQKTSSMNFFQPLVEAGNDYPRRPACPLFIRVYP